MNKFQNDLYYNLMQLVKTNEAFYYVDHVLNDSIYRVFTYRLASYEDFLLPDALECRGHMFRLNSDGTMDELVSMPFPKFFNYMENPFTMDVDFSQTSFIHDKRDGSLISTYKHEDMICLKSKTSLSSDQALDANNILRNDRKLNEIISEFVNNRYTVIMEYTSPDNRIVLPYHNHELKVLGVRCNMTGVYVAYPILYDTFGDYMVDDYTYHPYTDDVEKFIESIPSMKGIEGFVIGIGRDQRIKIKTEEYLSLHRAKDSINSNKRLFEVALNDATDDLRSLFHDDEIAIQRISDMEKIVGHAYNGMVNSVESYYEKNKELDRKSYAIKGQEELDRKEFGLAMAKYTGKEPDYKGMLMKHFKDYVEDDENDT